MHPTALEKRWQPFSTHTGSRTLPGLATYCTKPGWWGLHEPPANTTEQAKTTDTITSNKLGPFQPPARGPSRAGQTLPAPPRQEMLVWDTLPSEHLTPIARMQQRCFSLNFLGSAGIKDKYHGGGERQRLKANPVPRCRVGLALLLFQRE